MNALVVILALILLIVVHELGHMLTAKALGVRVPEFGIGFGPPLFRKKLGNTYYSFRIILLGGFAKIAGMGDGEEGPDTYYAKAVWKRAMIIFAGPAVNLVVAPLLLAVVFMNTGQPTTTVASVEEGTMAAQAGIEQGDRIIAVDGQRVDGWQAFVRDVRGKEPGDSISVTVERDGQTQEFTGELSPAPGNPEQPVVGVTAGSEGYGPLEALGLGVERSVEVAGLLFVFIGQLITGEQNFMESVNSPVGVVAVSSDFLSQSVISFIGLMAFISLQLGILNLLPILPLDGGHLLMLAAEKIKGSAVSERTMMRIAAVGLAAILTLFLFALYADISKIVSGQPFIPG